MSRTNKDLVKRQKEAVKQVNDMNTKLAKAMNDPKKQARKRTSKTGRSKGDKNVNYDPVNQVYHNQFGVDITKEEREQLRQAVNSVKRKQKRINSDTSGKFDAVKVFYSDHGEARGMLQELSTSINQFKSRDQFDHYMQSLNRWKQRGYEFKHMQQVKDNYIKSLEPTFMMVDPEFLEHLRKMDLTEFYQRRGDDLFVDFAYVNSDFQDEEDMYMSQIVHSFGYLTAEERLNGDEATDPVTGDKITVQSIKKKQQKQMRGKRKKK